MFDGFNGRKIKLERNLMDIIKVLENKDNYIDLLLLGDEQEDMIKKYLYRGELFALYDTDLKTVSVVTQENDRTYEIKNIATYTQYQRNGYGSCMINYLIEYIRKNVYSSPKDPCVHENRSACPPIIDPPFHPGDPSE